MFSVLALASVALACRSRTARLALAAGLLAGAAYLTKTAALPLLAAGPLYFAARRRYRPAMAFAAGMLPAVAGWNFWMRAHMGRPSDPLLIYYTDYFRYQLYNVDLAMLPQVVLKNGNAFLESIGALLVGPPVFVDATSPLTVAAFRLVMQTIGIVTLAGFLGCARRRGLTLYHWFAGLYVLLLLVWHYPPDERFLFPIMPVFVAGCWQEIAVLRGRLPKRLAARRPIAAAVAAAVCLWIGLGWWHSFRFLDEIREIARLNRTVYAWIARNTPSDATFLAYDDVVLHLYTGRTGYRPVVPTRFFYRDDEAAVERYVARSRIWRAATA